jgi:hypothetical protein
VSYTSGGKPLMISFIIIIMTIALVLKIGVYCVIPIFLSHHRLTEEASIVDDCTVVDCE